MKNIIQYHGYTQEQLESLSTHTLLSILDSSRGQAVCSCGKGHHCGDEYLPIDERWWNESQRELHSVTKTVLAGRPHVEDTRQVKKPEKKVMKY